MQEYRILKSNFIMKISNFQKTGEDENGKAIIKSVDEKLVKTRGKDFMQSLHEDIANGINRKVEVVNSAPVNFQFGVVYIRADGKMAWIWNLINE